MLVRPQRQHQEGPERYQAAPQCNPPAHPDQPQSLERLDLASLCLWLLGLDEIDDKRLEPVTVLQLHDDSRPGQRTWNSKPESEFFLPASCYDTIGILIALKNVQLSTATTKRGTPAELT